MSGIVGSYHNIRGSGVVAKLGTDGQLFTSAGAGVSQGFEAAAGGGTILQVQALEFTGTASNTATSPAALTDLNIAFTPTASSSKLFLQLSMSCGCANESLRGYFYDSTGGAVIGPIADAASSRLRNNFGSNEVNNSGMLTIGASAWFTPGDTTARTLQVFAAAQASTVIYINRTNTDTDAAAIANGRGATTFTITEYDGSKVTIS